MFCFIVLALCLHLLSYCLSNAILVSYLLGKDSQLARQSGYKIEGGQLSAGGLIFAHSLLPLAFAFPFALPLCLSPLPLPSLHHLCVLHFSLIQEKTGRIHTQAILKLKEDYIKKEVNLNKNPRMQCLMPRLSLHCMSNAIIVSYLLGKHSQIARNIYCKIEAGQLAAGGTWYSLC